MYGSEAIEKVPSIKSVALVTLESYPPQIAVRVVGEAPTGGWNNKGQLIEYIYFVPPVDGIYDMDLVSEAPNPNAPVVQVVSEITGFHVINPIPEGFKGVRVHGASNSVVAMLDDPTVSFEGARFFEMGVASSGGG